MTTGRGRRDQGGHSTTFRAGGGWREAFQVVAAGRAQAYGPRPAIPREPVPGCQRQTKDSERDPERKDQTESAPRREAALGPPSQAPGGLQTLRMELKAAWTR